VLHTRLLGVAIPLIINVIVVTINSIAMTITSFGVHVTRKARVPGLHVRSWRQSVVRFWGISAWTFMPRVAAGHVLAPRFASVKRSRSRGVVAETIIRCRFGGMTRWAFKGLCGWTSWKARGMVLWLLLGRLSG